MHRVLSVLVLLAVIHPALAQEKRPKKRAANEYPPQLAGARVEEYKRVGTTSLSAYIYEPAGHMPTDKRPAIVFFFGGGWTNGTPRQFEQHCRYLASRGMVAITADYRVASRHQVKVIDCIRDANSAMRWVRRNAERLGIDPHRIAAAGGSAGGHLAAATATLPKIMEPNEDGSYSAVPNALVLYNPAVALAPVVGDDSGRALEQIEGLRERFGAAPEAVSPAHHVKKDMPPTVMFFGTDDRLLTGAQYMQQQMKLAGNRCEIITYDGQAHGFFNFGRNENKFFVLTLKQTDAFLQSLGWLTGPDAVNAFQWSTTP